MKEGEPKNIEKSAPSEIKKIFILPAVFAVMLGASAAVGAILRKIDPPKDKYRMEIKVKPSKDDDIPQLKISFIKQCVDGVVSIAPGPASKAFYKDCE